jgi:starch synthase
MNPLAAGKASGFMFREASAKAFMAAVTRAHRAFGDPRLLRALRRNGMGRDFGWKASAERYVAIYERLQLSRARR